MKKRLLIITALAVFLLTATAAALPIFADEGIKLHEVHFLSGDTEITTLQSGNITVRVKYTPVLAETEEQEIFIAASYKDNRVNAINYQIITNKNEKGLYDVTSEVSYDITVPEGSDSMKTFFWSAAVPGVPQTKAYNLSALPNDSEIHAATVTIGSYTYEADVDPWKKTVDFNIARGYYQYSGSDYRKLDVSDDDFSAALSALTPQFTLGTGASVTGGNAARDFSSPQQYEIFAADGSSTVWTVSVFDMGTSFDWSFDEKTEGTETGLVRGVSTFAFVLPESAATVIHLADDPDTVNHAGEKALKIQKTDTTQTASLSFTNSRGDYKPAKMIMEYDLYIRSITNAIKISVPFNTSTTYKPHMVIQPSASDNTKFTVFNLRHGKDPAATNVTARNWSVSTGGEFDLNAWHKIRVIYTQTPKMDANGTTVYPKGYQVYIDGELACSDALDVDTTMDAWKTSDAIKSFSWTKTPTTSSGGSLVEFLKATTIELYIKNISCDLSISKI